MTFVSSSQVLVLAASDPHDRSRWDDIVDHAPISDVYYRSGYACASEAAGHGKAIGVLLATQRIRVLMPLLVRPLSELPFAAGEPGFDAATPYGYGGLLPLSHTERPAQAEVHALLDAFQQWCRDAGIISCLIRLHPLLEQDRWLGQGHWPQQATLLRYRLPTVAVDLVPWDSTRQRIAGLHRNRRAALNDARRCLRTSWSGSEVPLPEALALFQPIYEHRMASLNASSYYFFPFEYYASLAERLSNNLAVALTWLDEKLVGAAIFLVDRQFAHYHLTGSNEEGRKYEADTMLVNAGAHWARQRGCRFLHLGGGGDSNGLYRYKRSFGGDVYRYSTLDVIADELRYRDLVERRMRYELLPQAREGFFPQYRA